MAMKRIGLSKTRPGSPTEIQHSRTRHTGNSQSSTFIYSPLGRGCIRLIRIDTLYLDQSLHCTLSSAKLDEADKYDALSYAWNDETPTVPIHCNSQQLLVTPSLIEALRALYITRQYRYLWVDAICINQSNDKEKAIQVQMMDTIFSYATTVIVWLGPSTEASDMAMDSLKWLHNRLQMIEVKPIGGAHEGGQAVDLREKLESLSMAVDDYVWRGVADIVDRSWFRRLWTMQEVCLARYCVLLCGSRVTPLDDLFALIAALKDRSLLTMIEPATNIFEHTNTESSFAIAHQDYVTQNVWRGIYTPIDILMRYARTRETSNPLDKVYALLGLIDPVLRKQIKIDYSDENRKNYWQIYTKLGHLLLSENPNLYLLRYAFSKERPSNLPSWCPNFNSVQEADMLRPLQYRAGGTVSEPYQLPHIATSLNGRRIMLKGKTIDNVTHIGKLSWHWTSSNDKKGWSRGRLPFLQECLHLSGRCLGDALNISSLEIDKMPEALMRTLIGNCDSLEGFYAPSKEVLEQMFLGIKKLAYGACELGSYEDWILSNAEAFQSFNCLAAINLVCIGRRFFTTRSGRCGMGPRSIAPGDLVCVFRGTPVPLLLRPEGDEEIFKLVGEAYVHGAMEGQAFPAEEDEEDIPASMFTVA